jgi:integrase
LPRARRTRRAGPPHLRTARPTSGSERTDRQLSELGIVGAADRLAIGAAYEASGYVIVDEAGTALSPHALTSRWARMPKAAGVRHIRFHDARHTCGTLMHLQDVPIAVISCGAWAASKAFTMATYVHSQRRRSPERRRASRESWATDSRIDRHTDRQPTRSFRRWCTEG